MAGRVLVAGLLGLYAVLWAGGVAAHWLWRRTPDGANWSASAFLSCAAALLLVKLPAARFWLLGVGAAGFLVELAGATLGAPFGPYSYTAVLQPQIGGVPVVMACAWVILISYVKSLTAMLPLGRAAAVALGAAWMTAIDLSIDPVCTLALDYWRWRVPGPYYGIPWSNFAGWFLVSGFLLATGVRFRVEGPWVRRIGLSVVVFFGLLAAAHGLTGAAAAALGLTLVHIWASWRPGRWPPK